jgi:hypothetical protein
MCHKERCLHASMRRGCIDMLRCSVGAQKQHTAWLTGQFASALRTGCAGEHCPSGIHQAVARFYQLVFCAAFKAFTPSDCAHIF